MSLLKLTVLTLFALAAPLAVRAEDKADAKGGAAKHECPIHLQGTKVEAADLPDGASITFTNPANVDELRRRVRAMVEHHAHAKGKAKGKHAGMGHGGMGHGGMGHGGMMPAATRSAEDVPNGARVSIKPQDTKNLEALRTAVREHVKHLAAGHCPMMGAGGACECGAQAGHEHPGSDGGKACDCPMHSGKGHGEHGGGHDHHH